MELLKLIKDNFVTFDSYRKGIFYYNLEAIVISDTQLSIDGKVTDVGTYTRYQFSVPLDEVGDGTLLSEDKAIYYMKWIRRALEDKTLVKI